MSYDILTEEFGGQVQCAKVSAKSGEGIDELLEKVLLQVTQWQIKGCKPSRYTWNLSGIQLFVTVIFPFLAGGGYESTSTH